MWPSQTGRKEQGIELVISLHRLFHRSASCAGNDREIWFDHNSRFLLHDPLLVWLNKCKLHQAAWLSTIFQPHPGNSAECACPWWPELAGLVFYERIPQSLSRISPMCRGWFITTYGMVMMCKVVNVGTFHLRQEPCDFQAVALRPRQLGTSAMTRACCILYIEHLWSLSSGELSSLLHFWRGNFICS